MNNLENKQISKSKWPLILDLVALIAIAVVGYFIYTQSQTIIVLKNEMSSSTQILKQKIAILEAEMDITVYLANGIPHLQVRKFHL